MWTKDLVFVTACVLWFIFGVTVAQLFPAHFAALGDYLFRLHSALATAKDAAATAAVPPKTSTAGTAVASGAPKVSGDASADDSGEWEDAEGEDGAEEEEGSTAHIAALRLKMVLLVRKDLALTAADTAVAASGAAVGVLASVARSGSHEWRKWHVWWRRIGVAKIALRCPDGAALQHATARAAEVGLPHFVHGTSTASGEPAVLAIGPAPSSRLDPISGVFKLLS